MHKHGRIWGLLALILTTSLLPAERVTILHLNDTHGQIEAVEGRDGRLYGGFARIANLVDSLRTEASYEGSTVYFLHAGDALQGPPLSNLSGGSFDLELLNEMELDAMAVGNHEFDFGPENLYGLMELAEFPMLTANVMLDTVGLEVPVFQSHETDAAGNTRVVIIGLTTPRTPVGTHPDNVKDFSFSETEVAFRKELERVGGRSSDLVIALTHIGIRADSALAKAIPEIDVIVGGHSHTVLEEPSRVNNALVLQAGARTVFLGKLEANEEEGVISDWEYELILVSDSIGEDSRMAARIATRAEEVDARLDVPIGKTKKALVPGRARGRDEMSLGDLLAEVMMEETGADFAFTNAGGVRATINPGEVTMKDILTALPFGNTVVVMELTADQVQQVLDYDVSLAGQSGGSLHLAGITYSEQNGTAVDIEIGGESMDSGEAYQIATNNFLAAGGDGYEMLKNGSDIYDTGTAVNAMLVRYIEKVGTLK